MDSKEMMRRKFRLAYKKISTAKKILLVTHTRPDGDAVSSVCAIMLLLERLGIQYKTYSTDPAPSNLRFLPRSERIETDKSGWDFSSFDIIISLDCGSLSRTNLSEEISSRLTHQKVIEFDHHQKLDDYADLEIRDSKMSSTAELLYHFFKYNKIKIDKNIANCLLTGIMTDTATFLYPSTSEKTVKVASELLLYGAKYPEIVEETWRNKSLNAMRLWGKAMSNLKINNKYNFAITVLTKEEIDECNCSDHHFDGISGFLSNLHGVKGLLLLLELEKGMIKGSLRTANDDYDMSRLANYLGGGGHKKASGFYLQADLITKNNKWQLN